MWDKTREIGYKTLRAHGYKGETARIKEKPTVGRKKQDGKTEGGKEG